MPCPYELGKLRLGSLRNSCKYWRNPLELVKGVSGTSSMFIFYIGPASPHHRFPLSDIPDLGVVGSWDWVF